MRSVEDNHIWELVKLPEGRKPFGSMRVFKVKYDGEGQVERFKARWVAQGVSQTKGADILSGGENGVGENGHRFGSTEWSADSPVGRDDCVSVQNIGRDVHEAGGRLCGRG